MRERDGHLLIPKINEGVVIDHIPTGCGIRVLEILRACPNLSHATISLGMNYASAKMGSKDMIKVHESALPENVVEHLSLVAPGASVKRISAGKVDRRYTLRPVQEVVAIGHCCNPNCISLVEKSAISRFHAIDNDGILYRCAFCERTFRISLILGL